MPSDAVLVALIQERSAERVARIDRVKTWGAIVLTAAGAVAADLPGLLGGVF